MSADPALPRPGRPAAEAERETADVESASDDYARRFSGSVGRFFLEVQTRAVIDLLAAWPEGKILDVGGGHAQLAVPLAALGFRVSVTGTSEVCRKRLDRLLQPSAFEFHRCDLLHLPFPDRSFDAVTAFRLLPHVRRWPQLIAELCRVASEAVVVDYPDLRSFNRVQEAFFGWKKAIEKNTRPFRCFHRGELLDEFARHGFGNPVFRPELFWPMALHRGVRWAPLSRGLEAIAATLGLTRAFGSPVVMRLTRLS